MADDARVIETPAPAKLTPKRKNRALLMIAVPAALVVAVGGYYVLNAGYVSTDNAYVQQEKLSVSAEVGGKIVEVGVKENQRVKAGDLLFRIDPEPFQIAAAQADAAIASAEVKVGTMETGLKSTSVEIAKAREEAAFYAAEFQRQSQLMKDGFTTKARLDEAEHDLAQAHSRLSMAEADAEEKRAELATSALAPGVNPALLAAQVQKRKALMDLRRTEVRAPVSGVVSQADRLVVGQMMTQGLPALSLVAVDESWIEANFKETNLKNMAVGQPAELKFDAFPGMKLKGHVASIGAGTGSEFSVLPAQNANGNWVKVTQRVPVRIAIDEAPARPLIAGLSVHVRIDTR